MKKELIVILVCVLGAVAVVLLLILPVYSDLGSAQQSLNEQQEKLKEMQVIAEKIEALSREYEGNLLELEKLSSGLPQEKELAGIIVQLEKLASMNGLIMESISFKETVQAVSAGIISAEDEVLPISNRGASSGQTVSGGGASSGSYKTLAVQGRLIGGYSAFKNYLQEVEKNIRLMDITKIDFNAGISQDTTAYSFDIGLNIYYQ